MDLALIKYSMKVAPKMASALSLLADQILVVFVWVVVRLTFFHECDTANLAPFTPQRMLLGFFFPENLGRFLKVAEFTLSICILRTFCVYFGSINQHNFSKLRLTCKFNDVSLGTLCFSVFLLQQNLTEESSKQNKTHCVRKESSRNS